ncbi:MULTISPECIES: DUF4352 domain-containing protein [unclassified Methanoregula]|uniref:DUF4352 domain-containing protein n=1 Tax=unclassified Methanoregula TaxID=2649730 RepID=UPI0025FE2FB7|nr:MULTISPECIES: DUF4352 domain-containing protein [unclassified Methanoregula]
MAAKRCPKCGSTNPRYFTHCVECGAKLEEGAKKVGNTLAYVKMGLILCLAVVIIVYIVLPVYQHSVTIGKNASEAISAGQTLPPRIESSLNRPVGNSDLQITMNSARNGDNTFNSNRFFLVSVTLKNVRSTGNITVYSNDFTLVDTDGNSYSPYGIGSKVLYDLGPSQQVSGAEMIFVIPQKASVKEILFTFPGTSVLAGNRPVVAFVV